MRYKTTFLSKEYVISDNGKLYGKNGKIMKPSINPHGYLIANLMIDGKRIGVAIHTLVARAFCKGYQKDLTVNHKNGNKLDNHYTNLEWITSYENEMHKINILHLDSKGEKNGNARKIYAYKKKTGNYIMSFPSVMDAAIFIKNSNTDYNKLRIVQNIISQVALGRRKSYSNFYWSYKKYDHIQKTNLFLIGYYDSTYKQQIFDKENKCTYDDVLFSDVLYNKMKKSFDINSKLKIVNESFIKILKSIDNLCDKIMILKIFNKNKVKYYLKLTNIVILNERMILCNEEEMII